MEYKGCILETILSILPEHRIYRRNQERDREVARFLQMEARGEFRGLVSSEIKQKLGIKYLPADSSNPQP